MATGWNRISIGGQTWCRMLSFTGLLCSMTSLFFAVLGGLIVNGSIPIHNISFGVLQRHNFLQLLSIASTLIGTLMMAFGYPVKAGISNDLRNKSGIDRKDLIVPADVKQRPWLFYGGLTLLFLAALLQFLLMPVSLAQ